MSFRALATTPSLLALLVMDREAMRLDIAPCTTLDPVLYLTPLRTALCGPSLWGDAERTPVQRLLMTCRGQRKGCQDLLVVRHCGDSSCGATGPFVHLTQSPTDQLDEPGLDDSKPWCVPSKSSSQPEGAPWCPHTFARTEFHANQFS